MISVLEKNGAYIITIQYPTQEEQDIAMRAKDLFLRSLNEEKDTVKQDDFTAEERVKTVRVVVKDDEGKEILNKVLVNNSETEFLIQHYKSCGNEVTVTDIVESDDMKISDLLDFEGFEELADDTKVPFENR